MKREITCIVCPSSCRVTVFEERGGLKIEGYECRRGREHAVQEYRQPMRMLTSTVVVKPGNVQSSMQGNVHFSMQGNLPRLPVISSSEIPKAKIGECLELLYKISVSAPLQCGDIIVKNICETGVDIIASRSLSQ